MIPEILLPLSEMDSEENEVSEPDAAYLELIVVKYSNLSYFQKNEVPCQDQ